MLAIHAVYASFARYWAMNIGKGASEQQRTTKSERTCKLLGYRAGVSKRYPQHCCNVYQ